MKVRGKVNGISQLRARLRKLPDIVKAEIRPEVKASAQILERYIDAGAPARAIVSATSVKVSRDGLTATIGLHGKRANRKGFLARIFEFGAAPHEILPRGERKRAKRLRAKLGGRLPFEKARVLVTKEGRFLGKRVNHPGMSARPFFFQRAENLKPELIKRIRAAILRAAAKS